MDGQVVIQNVFRFVRNSPDLYQSHLHQKRTRVPVLRLDRHLVLSDLLILADLAGAS